jgi:TonB-linked SusC/RagA family outer membrane protein
MIRTLPLKCLSALLFAMLCSLASFSQQRNVTGKVTDSTGAPMTGVTVSVKGSAVSTSTGTAGTYSIPVATADAVLVFSSVGFTTEERRVGDKESIDLSLSAVNKQLDEVVVIGYGTARRKDITGAVVSLKSDVITQTPTHNALEAIQGRAPGLDITRASGGAGSGVNISIRGFKSIAIRDKMYERNAPLVIIDGFQGGDLSTLATSDIESMEILKDASSTAIYGAQGANGVIIVTTKKGSAGKLKVNYNGFFGLNTFQFPKARTGEDYLNLRREAFKNSLVGGVPEWQSPADDAKLFPNLPGEYAAFQANQWVDWIDLVSRNATQQSHNISVASGTDKTKYYLSAGYFSEKGMFRENDYDRFNVRLNLDQTISKTVKAGIISQITYTNQNLRKDPLATALTLTPLGQPYDSNGVVKQFPLTNDNRISPLADERNEYVAKDNIVRTNVNAGAYLEIAPIKGLTLRTNFNANLNYSRRGTYNDKTSLTQKDNQLSVATQQTNFTRFINWDNVLTYTKSFGDHAFTLTGITSYLQNIDEETKASGSGQILASQIYYGLGSTSTSVTRTITSPYYRWNNLAYAGRLNYSYKGRYVLYFSGRYDGASRLAPGKKWDFFPSAGLAWNVSDEDFFKNVTAVSNLKLRATYGVSGNYNIDIYGTQSGLTYTARMAFGEVPAPTYLFNPTVGNPDVGWEKTYTTNIGLDFGLLQNRITGSVDVFESKTKDILYKRVLPLSTGVTDVYENIASTTNKGIEVMVTSRNIDNRDFRWTTTATFSRTKQEIDNIVNGKDVIVDEENSLLIGQPITSFYTFRKLGIWQTSEAAEAATYRYGSATGNTFKPGDIKLQDISGPNGKPDGIIDATYDRAYIGSTVPDWIGGLQNTFTYKNFDLGVFLLFRYGQYMDAEFLGRYNPSGFGNSPAMLNYWTPENPTNDYPRPVKNGQLINYAGYQTLTYIDGSFWKVKNITVGYTLPKQVTKKFFVDNLRVYATASNAFTFAKSPLVKDYDPERGGAESSPIGRQFVFGINAGF